jgi:predicted LPLAT superfamily acyltransferase
VDHAGPDTPQSPDYGGNIGHAIFHAVLRLLGVVPAYFLLALVAPYYVLVRGSARRSAAPYLKRRFPGQSPIRRFFTTVAYFYRFGQALIDQAAMGVLGPERFHVDFPDEEALYRRARKGKGLILLTSHAGSWQTAMANMRCLDVPVHFQFNDEDHTAGRHFFDLAGERGAFRIISPTAFLGGMVEMTHALTAGECVSVMGDRAFGGHTREALFLGERAAFPIAAYHLAATTGADLVVLLTHRIGRLAYRIESHCITDSPLAGKMPASQDTALPREEAIEMLLGRYVGLLERYVAEHPFMWFNFFDFWATPQQTETHG